MDRWRVRVPWLLVAGSALLLLILLYLLFAAYLPAKQRIASLEAELKDLYGREAALQNQLAQQERRHALRDQQMTALVAEREALARRLEDLQRELAGRAPAKRR
jgi:septal ring factor EnvC (AmiA/AmiB activator)